jgi:hypothetical protein
MRTARLLVLVALTLAQPVAASAGPTSAYLGQPTNSVPPYHVLGAFHRAGPHLLAGSKPELLFAGTQIDDGSAGERWPIVKALGQFGTFTGLRPMAEPICSLRTGNAVNCALPPRAINREGLATFDWYRTRFSSRYVAFQHVDLIDRNLRMREHLSGPQLSLFRSLGFPTSRLAILQAALEPVSGSVTHFPLVAIGGYVETGADTAIPGDLVDNQGYHNLSFATVQESLQRGKTLGGASSSLVDDYNAEANVLTALICHADGLRPRSTCDRSVIRLILRHIK